MIGIYSHFSSLLLVFDVVTVIHFQWLSDGVCGVCISQAIYIYLIFVVVNVVCGIATRFHGEM